MKLRRAYILAIAIRILLAVSTRTFFQPDEYFQCLEPAHRIAFGYGHLTWEWVSSKPIRSAAYPAIWAWLFKLLALLGPEDDNMIVSHTLPLTEPHLTELTVDSCAKSALWADILINRYLHLQAGSRQYGAPIYFRSSMYLQCSRDILIIYPSSTSPSRRSSTRLR